METPLMPKATALWLIDNTCLTFDQIANFCGLHKIEVQAMADDQSASNLLPANPIDNGQLTIEEIKRCEMNPNMHLRLNEPYKLNIKMKTEKRYTPLIRRHDRPGAALWLIRHYPKMADETIAKLASTTKKMVQSVRDRTHKNMNELTPKDPVFLGFCTQIELNAEVDKIKDLEIAE